MAPFRRSKKKNDENVNIMKDKRIRANVTQIDNILGQANLDMYGTDRTSDVDALNSRFQKFLNTEVDSLTQKDNDDVTSFLSKLSSSDRKITAAEQILDNQFLNISGEDYSAMQGFIYDAYKNRLLEQSDLHEVASQLIELREAVNITRDAIISADVIEGKMNRTLSFGDIDDDQADTYIPMVEKLEEKFKLLDKIKNYIIPKSLEYGEYSVYVIPYSKIFNDFMKEKNIVGSKNIYRESTILESVQNNNSSRVSDNKKKQNLDSFIDQLYTEYVACDDGKNEYVKKHGGTPEKPNKEAFGKDIKTMLENITVSNESVPIPVLEEGFASMTEYMTEFVNESGDKAFTEAKSKTNAKERQNSFNKIINNVSSDGIQFTNDNKKKRKGKNEFDDIKDCYVKLIPPTKIIPIKIMDQVIGYYYVVAEDIQPIGGVISSTLYYSKFDEHGKQQTIVDSIAQRIVDSFDKDFLKENIKFKQTIVEAINYYNLNEKRLKFQFIPVEFIQEFKIDEDENGNGQSMLKKSLFYAKLYLMLLLFKIMSIILYSNDQKVNYIRTSGIDKNTANKVQEIARIRQSRQINIMDLFNYTTLINKVGNGNEMYLPTGRNNERPIETEILQGQDVQLNNDLMEMLKNAYVLSTGVPQAIINYLSEAEFAKVVEQNHAKFTARVVNYQLDYNPSITNLYKKIMKWSTNIPDEVIDQFEFVLQPPKTSVTNAKTETIQAFSQLCDFAISLLFEDEQISSDQNRVEKIRYFKKSFARKQLPMLNMDDMEELLKDSLLEYEEDKHRPNPKNGDNGDDDGLGDFNIPEGEM